MGSVNERNGLIFLDFRYKGVRCREYTKLESTKGNRSRANRLLQTIEAEITLGTFDYGKYFPNSKFKHRFDVIDERKRQSKAYFDAPDSPKFEEFAETWLGEKKVEWSKGHFIEVDGTINKYLLPTFGNKKISAINNQSTMCCYYLLLIMIMIMIMIIIDADVLPVYPFICNLIHIRRLIISNF